MAENYLAVEVQDVHPTNFKSVEAIKKRLDREGIKLRNLVVTPAYYGAPMSLSECSSLRGFISESDEVVMGGYTGDSNIDYALHEEINGVLNEGLIILGTAELRNVRGVLVRGWKNTEIALPIISRHPNLKYVATSLALHDCRSPSRVAHSAPLLQVYGTGTLLDRVVGIPQDIYTLGAEFIGNLLNPSLVRVGVSPLNVRRRDINPNLLKLLERIRTKEDREVTTYSKYLGLQ